MVSVAFVFSSENGSGFSGYRQDFKRLCKEAKREQLCVQHRITGVQTASLCSAPEALGSAHVKRYPKRYPLYSALTPILASGPCT